MFSGVLYLTWYKISKGIYEIDTKMDRAEKVNDVVHKKTKKEEKTNQKHKKKDGVIKNTVFEKKKIQKKRTEQCCIMNFLL